MDKKKTIKYIFFLAALFFLFFLARSGRAEEINMENPVELETVESVLESITDYLKGVAGTIAVAFIVIGGIMYMVSGGNKEMMERGKRTLLYAIAGLAIVLAAPTFYSEIVNILGSDGTSSIGGSSLSEIALNVLNLLLAISGTLALISLVTGSIWMFTAMGDQDRLELGKKTVIYSIIGIIIVSSSLIIGKQIATFLGAS